MQSRAFFTLLLALLFNGFMFFSRQAGSAPASQEIQLLVRGDDMGAVHAANVACLKAWRQGIVRSVEVLVPGSWFPEAVKLLKENPALDAGVHLCLTSEWEGCKWRPLTHAPSLTDENGYFYPMTAQRRDFPPKTGFLDAKPDPGEVEKELRAQIEMAKQQIPQISHLSVHMGTATATPALRAIVQKLAREFKLPLETDGVKSARGFSGSTPAEREQTLRNLLERLEPGRWLLVEHPGDNSPEMQALGHVGYYGVAAEREAVTFAFTSDKVKKVIRDRGIKLISYASLKSALRE